ncbi:MAG TPA: TIGR03618 family F420-dependent PPOX class oxidoreductase [Candidatus Binatia bacterium]|jgi:PPOX class probable F420-dependent enzyme
MLRRLNPELTAVAFGLAAILAGSAVAEQKPAAAAHPTPPSMSKAEIDAFLARPLVARIATVRKNGTPQVVPMWFLWHDGVMYLSTRTWAAKVKHLRKNPHVAVVVDVMEAPLKNKVVTIDGSAEILTDGVKETTTKIYEKYMGAEASKTPQAQQSINTPRVLIKITPAKIQSMDTTHP